MPDRPVAPVGEIVLYQTEDGRTRVECRFADETLWLSQALIAELFQKDVRTINEHLRNVFEEGELDSGRTIRKFRMVRREGARDVAREIEHYNLDAILAVGYRNRGRIGDVASESSFRICGARHLLGASRRVRAVSFWRDGSWLYPDPLSAGRLHASMGARAGVASLWVAVLGRAGCPLAPAPRRSAGVGGCHVPVYRSSQARGVH